MVSAYGWQGLGFIKGFRLVPLRLYPWALGSFQGTVGTTLARIRAMIRAILGKPLRGRPYKEGPPSYRTILISPITTVYGTYNQI